MFCFSGQPSWWGVEGPGHQPHRGRGQEAHPVHLQGNIMGDNYNPSIFTSYKFFLSLYLVITKAVFYGQIQWDIHGYVSRFFSSSSIQLQIQ